MKVMVIVKANQESEAGTMPISVSISELLGCETGYRPETWVTLLSRDIGYTRLARSTR